MVRPYPTVSLDARITEYSATVHAAFARSSLPLRILLALVFPFYALTASKSEFASVLILAWLITQLLSAAEGREEAIVTYDGLSRYLVHTYTSAALVCRVFPNPWLRLFATFFVSFFEMQRLFPFADLVYRIVYDADANRLKNRDRSTHKFAHGFSGLIGASWALCSGAIDGNGSILWLLLQFTLVNFMVGSSVRYASVALMLVEGSLKQTVR